MSKGRSCRGKEFMSLGGSLIAPKDVLDIKFINDFKELILQFVRKKRKNFVIVCGGGKIARDNMDKYKKANPNVTEDDLHLVGIETTRSNAASLAGYFGDLAYQIIINLSGRMIIPNKKIIFTGGTVPGHTTDFVTASIAYNSGASSFINLSNIPCVYNMDPKKFGKIARGIKTISWRDFRRLIPLKCKPGHSYPLDPKAAELAEKKGMKVIIMSGYDLENIKSYLMGNFYEGTTIANGLPLKYYPKCYKFKGASI